MALDNGKIDEHISSLREGNTLTENEVKALCEKVNIACDPSDDPLLSKLPPSDIFFSVPG